MKSKRVRGAEEVWDTGSVSRSGKRNRSTNDAGVNESGVGVRVTRYGVADRLHSAAIRLLRTVRNVDTQSGISPARLSALSVLVFAGRKSLRELADIEQVSPPTMSKTVQRLEADGLAQRKSDQRDRRAIHLGATSKGKSTLKRARKLRIDSLAELLKSTSKSELAILNRAAQIIEKAVNR